MAHQQHRSPFDHELLVMYQKALQWLHRAKVYVDRIPRGFRKEADELMRASTSIVGNIAEGVGRRGNARANHDQISRGSTGECACCLDVCEVWGWASSQEVEADKTLLSELAKMLHGAQRQARPR